jgi:hypothetical protein
VVTSVGQADVAADGKFTAKVYQGGPMMAFALDATGKTVMFGFVGGGQDKINARSTAEALAYFASGAYRLPSSYRANVFDALRTRTELDAVTAKITARVAADPTAVDKADAEIVAALDASVGSLVGPEALGHLINPTETKSGIEVQADGLETIKIVNYFRRRALAYVDRVSYKTDDGVEHPSAAAVTKVDISPTTGVTSVVGSLGDWIQGKSAYNPVSTDPIKASVEPTTAKTTLYKVTVIGAGADPGEVESLPKDRQDEQDMLTKKTVVVDLFFPLLLNVALPAKSDAIDQMLGYLNSASIVYDFINVVTTTAPDIWAKSSEGDLVGGAWALIEAVSSSAAIKVAAVQMLRELITHYSGLFWGETFNNGAAIISKLATSANIALQILDSCAQIADIARSQQAATWDVTANKSKVLLNPPFTEIGNGGETELTCTVPDASGTETSLTFEWTKEGGALQMADGIHTGNSFESSKNKVQLKGAWNGSTGMDTITVEAFQIKGSSRVSLGTAKASVKISAPKPFLTPSKISVKPNGTFTVTGGVKPAPAGNPSYIYRWTLKGSGATFDAGALQESGTRETNGIKALSKEGSDVLTLEVLQVDGGKQISLGKATAEVRVETTPSIFYGTINAHIWYDYDPVSNWTSSQWGVWVEFPDVPGATSYTVSGFDNMFNSPVVKTGPPFDQIRDLSASMHGFGLWGGAGFGPGPPDTSGDADFLAAVKGRFNGTWEVEVRK